LRQLFREISSLKRLADGSFQVGADSIREFLKRELPPGKIEQVAYLTSALVEAGLFYDRHAARRDEWLSYARRKHRLLRIESSASRLAAELSKLDVFSHDELAVRFGSQKLEELIGSLFFLSKKIGDITSELQKDGRPRDLAEERWIMEVADIYENAFGRPARVWGSGTGPIRGRGSFYRLLEVSRPSSFARHGKLSLRQIERKLEDRRRKTKPTGWDLLAKIRLKPGGSTQ
jgi:hypothetical protein